MSIVDILTYPIFWSEFTWQNKLWVVQSICSNCFQIMQNWVWMVSPVWINLRSSSNRPPTLIIVYQLRPIWFQIRHELIQMSQLLSPNDDAEIAHRSWNIIQCCWNANDHRLTYHNRAIKPWSVTSFEAVGTSLPLWPPTTTATKNYDSMLGYYSSAVGQRLRCRGSPNTIYACAARLSSAQPLPSPKIVWKRTPHSVLQFQVRSSWYFISSYWRRPSSVESGVVQGRTKTNRMHCQVLLKLVYFIAATGWFIFFFLPWCSYHSILYDPLSSQWTNRQRVFVSRLGP